MSQHTSHGHGASTDERQHVWDNARNVKLLFNVFYACCVILVLLDFVIHRHNVHDWENLLAFYPLYGFVGIWNPGGHRQADAACADAPRGLLRGGELTCLLS